MKPTKNMANQNIATAGKLSPPKARKLKDPSGITVSQSHQVEAKRTFRVAQQKLEPQKKLF